MSNGKISFFWITMLCLFCLSCLIGGMIKSTQQLDIKYYNIQILQIIDNNSLLGYGNSEVGDIIYVHGDGVGRGKVDNERCKFYLYSDGTHSYNSFFGKRTVRSYCKASDEEVRNNQEGKKRKEMLLIRQQKEEDDKKEYSRIMQEKQAKEQKEQILFENFILSNEMAKQKWNKLKSDNDDFMSKKRKSIFNWNGYTDKQLDSFIKYKNAIRQKILNEAIKAKEIKDKKEFEKNEMTKLENRIKEKADYEEQRKIGEIRRREEQIITEKLIRQIKWQEEQAEKNKDEEMKLQKKQKLEKSNEEKLIKEEKIAEIKKQRLDRLTIENLKMEKRKIEDEKRKQIEANKRKEKESIKQEQATGLHTLQGPRRYPIR